MAFLPVEKQIERIRRGTAEIFPEGELRERLKKSVQTGEPLRVKLGVDPTAKELHLGHFIPVLKLRQFQELGHQAVLVIGDYTAMVGDPSGRSQTRPTLSHDEVLANSETYQEQVFQILDPHRTEVVYNGSWLSKLSFQDVTELLAHTTVARMLEREDFHNRFTSGVPISLHEFVYPLMQGHDSVAIRADVELGGTDQKFNILVGRDLQREAGLPEQIGVCLPILLGLDGKEKMSKSLGNTITLFDPPPEKYGKVMSIPDGLMRMYYELLTEVPSAEIDELLGGVEEGRLHPRDVKRRLAREVVSRFDGAAAAAAAESHFDRVFSERGLPDEMDEVQIPDSEVNDGKIWLVRLVALAGFAGSNAEARRLISQGGVRIDETVLDDPALDWPIQEGAVLRVGRRRFARVRSG